MSEQKLATVLSFAAAVGATSLMAVPNEAQAQRGPLQTVTQVCTMDNDPEVSLRLEANFRENTETGVIRIVNLAATRLSPPGRNIPEELRPDVMIFARFNDGALVEGSSGFIRISGRKQRFSSFVRNEELRFVQPDETFGYTVRRNDENGEQVSRCIPSLEFPDR